MDKAPDFESGDCGFESHQNRLFCPCIQKAHVPNFHFRAKSDLSNPAQFYSYFISRIYLTPDIFTNDGNEAPRSSGSNARYHSNKFVMRQSRNYVYVR